MTIRYTLALAVAGLLATSLFAQTEARKTPMQAKLINIFDPQAPGVDFEATLQNLEAPMPGGESYRSFLARQKAKQRALHPVNRGQKVKRGTSAVNDMILGDELGTDHYLFDIPRLGGTPNDNTMAISDGCMLLTSWNTEVWGYDLAADTNLFTAPFKHPSFTRFSGNNDLFFPFDPKLYYDHERDRFFILFLSGRGPNNSEIIVCFSSTNYPTDPWYVYSIPGNPHGNNTWTDYPALTVTDDEIFITVNLLLENEPWETGFDETIIWQVGLDEGYNGDANLNTMLWDDINYNGEPLRYLCPVKGALGPEGPNAYFLGNRPWDLTNDSLFLVEVTGTQDDVNTTLNITQSVLNTSYGMPPEAQQPDGLTFQTNDARWLGGVLIGDDIQFVGNTIDPNTGLCAVYHGFIEDVTGTPTVSGEIINHPEQDFGYPNIAYSGADGSDDETVIVFDHCSPDDFPGYSAVNYSDGEYSDILVVKEGQDVINRLGGNPDRWGDYSGIQRKYNEPGKVWTAATYGYTGGNNSTWLGELKTQAYSDTQFSNPDGCSKVPTGVEDVANAPSNVKLYPNPTVDRVTVQFTLEEKAVLTYDLYALDGRLVQRLGQGRTKTGLNEFGFSTLPLANGTYLLKIYSAEKTILSQRVVKQ